MRSVVITGASTGIVYATAAELCRRGCRVFGSVRNEDQADRLLRDWGAHFTPLVFDVTDAGAVEAAAARVKSAIGDGGLSGLVNNAGISNPGPLSVQSPEIVRQHRPLTELMLTMRPRRVEAPFRRCSKGKKAGPTPLARPLA